MISVRDLSHQIAKAVALGQIRVDGGLGARGMRGAVVVQVVAEERKPEVEPEHVMCLGTVMEIVLKQKAKAVTHKAVVVLGV